LNSPIKINKITKISNIGYNMFDEDLISDFTMDEESCSDLTILEYFPEISLQMITENHTVLSEDLQNKLTKILGFVIGTGRVYVTLALSKTGNISQTFNMVSQ